MDFETRADIPEDLVERIGVEYTGRNGDRLEFNIDPQHSGDEPVVESAVEKALRLFDENKLRFVTSEAVLVTTRPDLDSVAAMAVLALSVSDPSALEKKGLRRRIARIGEADRFASDPGPWAPVPLPTHEEPWLKGRTSVRASQDLAAIAALAADRTEPLRDRVRDVADWLQHGNDIASYRLAVEQSQELLVAKLESGQVKIEDRDGIAVVDGDHPGAWSLGYCVAPIIVTMVSPRENAGEEYPKVTIAQWDDRHVKFPMLINYLNGMEADAGGLEGWGGSPTIVGSPQGEGGGTRLSLGAILRTVRCCRQITEPARIFLDGRGARHDLIPGCSTLHVGVRDSYMTLRAGDVRRLVKMLEGFLPGLSEWEGDVVEGDDEPFVVMAGGGS